MSANRSRATTIGITILVIWLMLLQFLVEYDYHQLKDLQRRVSQLETSK